MSALGSAAWALELQATFDLGITRIGGLDLGRESALVRNVLDLVQSVHRGCEHTHVERVLAIRERLDHRARRLRHRFAERAERRQDAADRSAATQGIETRLELLARSE